MVVDLPTPGGPVRPITWARPVTGANSRMIDGSSSAWFSTRLINRPIARG
jgi:hypothetical protein